MFGDNTFSTGIHTHLLLSGSGHVLLGLLDTNVGSLN